VLLAITSPGDHPKDAVLKMDMDKLGITPQLPWQEFVGVRALCAEEKAPAPELDHYGGRLTLKGIPAKGGRLVAIRKH